MDHTPGQRQWTEIEHSRLYYTGKKGWSNEKFAAEMRIAPERQAQFAEPHRRCRTTCPPACCRRHGSCSARRASP